jgi:hypothetical protein
VHLLCGAKQTPGWYARAANGDAEEVFRTLEKLAGS